MPELDVTAAGTKDALEVDYLIVGGGPAGVQLAYFLQQAGCSYVVTEAEQSCGAFFHRFPRHRHLLSINKLYTGCADRERQLRWDWNSLLSTDDDIPFRAYSREYFPDAQDLARYVEDFSRRHALHVLRETRIRCIGREPGGGGGYVARDERGREYRARRLVIATGMSKPNLPPIEGLELTEPYHAMSVDPQDFVDQRVLILGKGNSAFETGTHLVATARLIHLLSPSPVRLAWRTHYVGDLRARNNSLIDTYQLKSQNALLDATVDSIRKHGNEYAVQVHYVHNDEVEVLRYDRVLNCMGFAFDSEPFAADCRPELRHCQRLPLQTSAWESTNQPGMYFAGTLTQVRDAKVSTSAFIHGFRYNVRALFRILQCRHHGRAWPHTRVARAVEPVLRQLVERMNSSSALWQQFGFLGDVLCLEGDGYSVYEEVPLDYLREERPFADEQILTLTLEYGEQRLADPMVSLNRVHRERGEEGQRSEFLHPVVRCYRHGELVASHHVIEDLAAEWCEPEHVDPLRAFLERQAPAAVSPGTHAREPSGPRREDTSVG